MAISRAFVTGGAGFIGSNLVDRLLSDGYFVTVYDNFATGFENFLAPAKSSTKFSLVKGDILSPGDLKIAMHGSDIVFHLAANADVRFGTHHPERDLNQNTIGTFNVLEAMRATGVRKIAFSSTGSVYGETLVTPTPEDGLFPIQTSLYGASKLAGEGLIQAYCEGFNMQCWIFRFVSVMGERYTHGHVFDFYKKLRINPSVLHVLGNGLQRKSYMAVSDCVDAILIATNRAKQKINIFNLGTDGYCQVNDSIGWICQRLGVHPELVYSGGERGWIGDVPFIYLDTTRIRALGWEPKATIRQGVERTVDWLVTNQWVLDARD